MVSVHAGCRPRKSSVYLNATRTMQGRRPFIGNEQYFQYLQDRISSIFEVGGMPYTGFKDSLCYRVLSRAR